MNKWRPILICPWCKWTLKTQFTTTRECSACGYISNKAVYVYLYDILNKEQIDCYHRILACMGDDFDEYIASLWGDGIIFRSHPATSSLWWKLTWVKDWVGKWQITKTIKTFLDDIKLWIPTSYEDAAIMIWLYYWVSTRKKLWKWWSSEYVFKEKDYILEQEYYDCAKMISMYSKIINAELDYDQFESDYDFFTDNELPNDEVSILLKRKEKTERHQISKLLDIQKKKEHGSLSKT